MRKIIFILSIFLLFAGCTEKKEASATVPGMKCGAGKCGANMFDGNSAIEKKKKNLLTQMRDDDSRRDCVINAETTKMAYNCVRDPHGKKLILKCGKENSTTDKMKCGADKCGESMSKKESVMKCAPGKCG